MGYPRVQKLHGLDAEEIKSFVQDVYEAAEVVHPREPMMEVVPMDPDDNPILQTAVVGRADVLCTLDRHFQAPAVTRFAAERGFRIVTDVELLAEVRGEGNLS